MVTNILSIGLIAVEKPVKIDDLHNGQGTVLYNHNMVEIMVKNEDGNIVDPVECTGPATGLEYRDGKVRRVRQ